MSNVQIVKPIAKYPPPPLPTTTTTTTGLQTFPVSTLPTKPLAVAGSTIKEGSIVYLLHQFSYNLLLNEFYDPHQNYHRIPVHSWSQHLIGPGLFQEWILTIKTARTPDEQNIEFFQSAETNLLGFRTTRVIAPNEPLLAWFSLSQLRVICEKIKMSKVFKVEELLKSTRCPRCQVEKNYLNVLVAHVLLDQCEDYSIRTEERLVRTSSNKKRLEEKISSSRATSIQSVKSTNNNEENKTNDAQRILSSNEISSYKMSVLDGTHALEFTSLDTDGRQRKAHLCLFCGKIYNRKYGLKIHLRTHTGYKPLQCRICFRPFSDPSNLNKHIRLHSTASSSSSNGTALPSKKRPFEEQDESNIDSETSHVNPLDVDDDDDEDQDV